MKNLRLLFCLVAITFFAQSIFSQAYVQHKVYYSKYYEEKNSWKDYLPGQQDWVVLFKVPDNARDLKMVAMNSEAGKVLRGSNIDFKRYQGKQRYVHVIVGSSGRKGYKGNLASWAKSIYLECNAPFKPRG